MEFLSPATADYDRQNKLRMYLSLPNFCEYLLVEQDEFLIEKYSKKFQGWFLSDFNNLEESILLDSAGVELPIEEIYREILNHP